MKLITMDEDLKKVVDYILTSTEFAPYVNNPGAKEKYSKGVEFLSSTIENYVGFLRGRGRELGGNTPIEKIKDTPYYKMAELCKAATSKAEFIAMAKEIFKGTSYGKAPVALLQLGRFKWKTEFEYPTRAYKASKRKHPTITAKKEKPVRILSGPEALKKMHDAFSERIGQLAEKVLQLEERLDDLGEADVKGISLNGLKALQEKLDSVVQVLENPVFIRDEQLCTLRPISEVLK